jgi:hypothetical protein
VRHAIDEYRATLAKVLYLAACIAIIIDRIVRDGIQRNAFPSFVIARISGGLLALNSVLVRAAR